MKETDNLENLSLDDLYNELRLRGNKNIKGKRGLIGRTSSLRGIPTASLHRIVRSKQRAIYLTDDRKDFYQIQDEKILKDLDSVAILVKNNILNKVSQNKFEIVTEKFGDAYNLCREEVFRDQPIVRDCGSGFLVTSDIIATAAHCIDNCNNCINIININEARFVFGYRMNSLDNVNKVIDDSEIYRAQKLIGRTFTEYGPDWALVKLDRPVENHQPVKLRRSGKIKDNEEVHVIGHPCGLPVKIAKNAFVRDNSNSSHITCNLDTFGGNSGSPVFNSNTGEVEAILVRGETDFEPNGSCNKSVVCPTTGCIGEDCTRTTEFIELIESNSR
jgi:V8-like Glu-specific endopeptidase